MSGLAQSLVNHLVESRFLGPMSIALELALSRDDHFIELAQAAEMLKEGAVGQAHSEAAKVLLEVGSQNIAAQGAAGLELEIQLGFGRDVLGKSAGRQPTSQQKPMDLLSVSGS